MLVSVAGVPRGDRVMAVMTGYFDDSRDGLDRHILALAGMIGIARKWEKFERRWKQILDKHDVPWFHMKEMASPSGPFSKWLPQKHHANEVRNFLSDLTETIDECRLDLIASIVRIPDLNRF